MDFEARDLRSIQVENAIVPPGFSIRTVSKQLRHWVSIKRQGVEESYRQGL
jgi:hypothetical protein